MLTQILLLISSLAILILAAEGLVRGASRLALRLGVSNFVIGVVVIGFGTSAPELAASLASATAPLAFAPPGPQPSSAAAASGHLERASAREFLHPHRTFVWAGHQLHPLQP